MRKFLFYTTLIILVILSGCSDFAAPGLDDERPVEIESVPRGGILPAGSSIDLEYEVNDTQRQADRLEITLTGPSGAVVSELAVEENPLPGWHDPLEIAEDAVDGLYTLRFDFYSGEDLFYSELREFFVADRRGGIEGITSYPPVLYPGGGGLIHALTDINGEGNWLRWSLDGEVIAEGLISSGFGSIEITAPGEEGVYSLSLEVFPAAPADGSSFGFKSGIIKEVPLYVNMEQKSGTNEFGPPEDFYSIYHFRGNLINSTLADSDPAPLQSEGNPVLSVRSGVFGYYLDSQSRFFSDKFGLPVENGELQAFSVMTAFVPFDIGSLQEDFSSELYYAGTEDGSFGFRTGIFPDGRADLRLTAGDLIFAIESDVPVVADNEYSSLAAAVQPLEDGRLELSLYADGVRVAEEIFPLALEDCIRTDSESGQIDGSFRLAAGLDVLVDEAGIYSRQAADGTVVDPDQFRRSMELEHGKFLMFADGFDDGSGDLEFSDTSVTVKDSVLSIPAGGSVGFPPLYPGYEEVIFRIELADQSSATGTAVIYVEGGSSEVVSVDIPAAADFDGQAEFSLIFSKESVLVSRNDGNRESEALAGDFSSVGYSIVNNGSSGFLMIESIVVIRKNISISENSIPKVDIISTEIKTRS